MKKRILLPETERKNAADEQNTAYAAALKKMTDCKTVWTKTDKNKAEFEKFYRVIEENFPTLHAKAKRLTFGGGCFFYVIEGANPKKNILLMSHHDVVDGGEGWESDPFNAVIKNGHLYGRGSIDTKTPLFAQLQAAEELLCDGFAFEGFALYIGSSNNEEYSGDGMVLASDYFRREGIRFDVILDEGGAIISGLIPGVKNKSAMVAIHEKSRHIYRCTVSEASAGHGGLIPTKGSPVETLGNFVTEVSKSKIFKSSFVPEVKGIFTNHAPYMAFPLKLVFGAFELFSPVIKKIMGGIPTTSAMLSTGVTFTAFSAGDPKSPGTKAKTAEVFMYLRCIREETLKTELVEVKKLASKFGVEIEEILRDYCEPSSADSAQYKSLEKLLNKNYPDVIVAPYLLTAGTDARRFTGLSDNIFRFAPIDLNKEQFASIHSANENINIKNIGQCVLFYKDYIKEQQL